MTNAPDIRTFEFMLQKKSDIHPIPFNYFCSTRETVSTRYFLTVAVRHYFVAQAALKRHYQAKVLNRMDMEC